MVDKQVHDRFGNEILDRLPNDVEIRCDERSDQGGFHLLAGSKVVPCIRRSLQSDSVIVSEDVAQRRSNKAHRFQMFSEAFHVIRRTVI